MNCSFAAVVAATLIHTVSSVLSCRFVPRSLVRGLQWFQRTDPNPYVDHPLFAPVKAEVFTKTLEVVEGEVPGDLDGVYIRTGSNPQHRPWGGLHW